VPRRPPDVPRVKGPRPEELTIDLGLGEPGDDEALQALVARRLSVPKEDLGPVHVRKRSLDARRGHVRFHLTVGFGEAPPREELGLPRPREVTRPADVLIVGDGPAGLFCAHQLARSGIGATILERGKPVQPRRRDLRGLNRLGVVDPESNYCFGEGGAGTYSDGKLYTRAHKRGSVRDVIEILARHGAPEAILKDARPHIGSNRLPMVVTSLREELEAVGTVFRFGARVVGLLATGSGDSRRACGVRLADGEELGARAVVLATGHSAADVHAMLEDLGVALERKPFAMGLRVEHPQVQINELQYGKAAGHPDLPAASYALAQTVDGRGVFSFCMCPGGWIVPASTEPGGLVGNGMSLSRRDSPHANSGLVVAVEPEDLDRIGLSGVRGGLEVQRRIEAAAFQAGGGGLRAPATRLTDFAEGRGSSTVPASSYEPGLAAGDVAEVLAVSGLGLAERLRSALRAFDRKLRGYVTEEAVLVAAETRTSSPVRVLRDRETFEAQGLGGLYPAGEGAGYAGGIMSAAMDGMRVAEAVAARLSVRS
jgi:uncharacterized protein